MNATSSTSGVWQRGELLLLMEHREGGEWRMKQSSGGTATTTMVLGITASLASDVRGGPAPIVGDATGVALTTVRAAAAATALVVRPMVAMVTSAIDGGRAAATVVCLCSAVPIATRAARSGVASIVESCRGRRCVSPIAPIASITIALTVEIVAVTSSTRPVVADKRRRHAAIAIDGVAGPTASPLHDAEARSTLE